MLIYHPCPVCKSAEVVYPVNQFQLLRVRCGSCELSTPWCGTELEAASLWAKITEALRG